MMRWWISFAVVITVCAGCVTHLEQPSLSQATMMPNDLKPGDDALITVVVEDSFKIVDRIEGRVLEDTTIRFKFRDDGKNADAVADDGVWSMKVQVPFNAPPGGFTFEIQAFDSNDNLIVVTDVNKEAVPLVTTVKLNITFPETVLDDEGDTE
jgi:hypothetical protein